MTRRGRELKLVAQESKFIIRGLAAPKGFIPAPLEFHIMSYLIAPFEVSSRALAEPVKVRFVHLFAAIATRHSDTVDAVFLVDGRKAIVAISFATLAELRERQGINLTDQQLADMAALYLRRTLEQGYEATEAELFLQGEELEALGRELGYR